MIDCCNDTRKINKTYRRCIRKKDKKIFKLPRKFTRKQCKNIRGFSMKSSCAPYKYCDKSYYLDGGKRTIQGIAVINMNGIRGNIYFIQKNKKLIVKYSIKGLKDGLHGFHIHRYGDMSDGCKRACEHFDPTHSKHHGGPHSSTRHAGDLGNIQSKNGIANGSVTVEGISVDPKMNNSIIGRMIIIHKGTDDLGKGKNIESTTTGNSGERIACAVIGIRSTEKCM